MTTQRIYDAAVLGNDAYPDDVCPGCHQDISAMWESTYHRYHFRPDAAATYHQVQRRLNERKEVECRWPWVPSSHGHGLCTWSRDDLAARAHARRLIAEGVTTT